MRPPWRPHDCTKRESLLVFSVARASRSVSRAFAPGRASRGPRLTHSHGAQWPFQTLVRCRLAAAATPGAHGTPPAQAAQNRRSLTLSESPRGLNPLNCCALALPRPLPHGPWRTLWYAISYDLQWHRAVNEQSLRHGCYIHARLRRAFELFDYDNTTLHLPVRSHPVPRRSHRPHTAPPCICIRAEADPSIALRCTAES